MYNIMNHEIWMRRCLDLASCGAGNVAPNPMVGSVIVCQDRIIGSGYHRKYGGAHAEIHALDSVRHKELLNNSTLYVNLEPCAHQGKTPPCTDAIIEAGIPQVVIGSVDPDPRVNGGGIRKLREAGITVLSGVLQNECDALNRRFFTFHKELRPYVILKWAASADGYLDILRKENMVARPTWITGETERRLVHRWRSEESGILIGTRTAMLDNPSLTVRNWAGQHPVRMVIDRNLALPNHLSLFDGAAPTLVFSQHSQGPSDKVEYIPLDFSANILREMLPLLYQKGILSLLVEGGAYLIKSFIDNDMWDEARVFSGQQYFHEGVAAPELDFPPQKVIHFPSSSLSIFRNK